MGLMNEMMCGMMASMNPSEKQDTMLKMMPKMMKRIKGPEIWELIGKEMGNMMFITHKSKYNFTETLQKIKQSGISFGWYRPEINNHFEIERDMGLDSPNKVATISMCIPRSAHKILKVNQKLAVMMPMQINVHEENNKVYITWMNIKMMGKMFGEIVAGIMEKAQADLQEIHKDIIENKGGKNGSDA